MGVELAGLRALRALVQRSPGARCGWRTTAPGALRQGDAALDVGDVAQLVRRAASPRNPGRSHRHSSPGGAVPQPRLRGALLAWRGDRLAGRAAAGAAADGSPRRRAPAGRSTARGPCPAAPRGHALAVHADQLPRSRPGVGLPGGVISMLGITADRPSATGPIHQYRWRSCPQATRRGGPRDHPDRRAAERGLSKANGAGTARPFRPGSLARRSFPTLPRHRQTCTDGPASFSPRLVKTGDARGQHRDDARAGEGQTHTGDEGLMHDSADRVRDLLRGALGRGRR